MAIVAGELVDPADFAHTDDSAPGTVPANFTDAGSYAVRFGPLVMLSVYVNSTNAITATNGNVSDLLIFTAASQWRPPVALSAIVANGLVDGEAVLNTTGSVQIRAAAYSFTAGSNLRVNFQWIDAPPISL